MTANDLALHLAAGRAHIARQQVALAREGGVAVAFAELRLALHDANQRISELCDENRKLRGIIRQQERLLAISELRAPR